MSWTVSNLQRPFREDFSLEKSGIIAEKESQIFGRRFVGFDGPKKAAPFLKADGLEDGYKVLTNFNGTVLAGASAAPIP